MKARCVFIAAIWTSLVAVNATAETMVVRPDQCAVTADAPKLVMLAGVEASDLNPDRARADHILVLYPVPSRGWASARILARFDVEREPRRRTRHHC